MNRILIIGGAGYLGSVLSRMLLDKGYKVRVFDSLIYGDNGIKDLYSNNNFEIKEGDIRSIQDIMEAINGVDSVIHLAALVGDHASALDPEETIEINHVCTKVIAGLCKYKKIQRFIFASSCSVYGTNESDDLLIEESTLNPISLYAKMKLKSEYNVLELSNDTFHPTVLRMGTLYGASPRMRFDLVVNLFTMKALIDKEITIFGGNQKRPFCHVKDAALAYIKCLESPIDKVSNEIFNVATENYIINDLGSRIIDNIPDSKIVLSDKDYDKRDYIASSGKIHKELGFSGNYTIVDGVKEMIELSNKWGNYKDIVYDNYATLKHKGLKSYDGGL